METNYVGKMFSAFEPNTYILDISGMILGLHIFFLPFSKFSCGICSLVNSVIDHNA